MRLVRILLVALAVVAVGLAGWALGARDAYNPPATGDPAPAASAPAAEAAVSTPVPAPREQATPDPTTAPAANPAGTTRPTLVPKPRIFGFGSEPVLGDDGETWELPAGGGEAYLITDADHATKVEFLWAPTGTGAAGPTVSIGVDRDGPDYTARWRYDDVPLRAHLTVRATGPGGTTEHTVNLHHPEQP